MARGLSGIDISLKPYDKYNTTTTRYHWGYISAANTYRIANTMGAKMVGILQDASPNTSSCVVRIAGVTKVYMNDTCAVGDFVIGNTTGSGENTTSTTYTSTSQWPLIGIANEACSATGTVIEVIMTPSPHLASAAGTL